MIFIQLSQSWHGKPTHTRAVSQNPFICGRSVSMFLAPDAVTAITKLTIVRTSTHQLRGGVTDQDVRRRRKARGAAA